MKMVRVSRADYGNLLSAIGNAWKRREYWKLEAVRSWLGLAR